MNISRLIEDEVRAANESADRRERCINEHGYGCTRAECGRSVARQITGLTGFLTRLVSHGR